jgi:mannose-6-phosphate isomerase-like protein (cupin superfamily)
MANFGEQAASHVRDPMPDGTPGNWFDAVPGERVRIRVDSRTVAGAAYTIIESVAQAMVGPPLHRHREDEIFYIVEGCLAFQCGTERFDAPAGSIIVAPAGTPHCWFNFGPEPARMVVTFAPGGQEEVFLGLADVASTDLPAYAALHDIDVLGPPLGVAP